MQEDSPGQGCTFTHALWRAPGYPPRGTPQQGEPPAPGAPRSVPDHDSKLEAEGPQRGKGKANPGALSRRRHASANMN